MRRFEYKSRAETGGKKVVLRLNNGIMALLPENLRDACKIYALTHFTICPVRCR